MTHIGLLSLLILTSCFNSSDFLVGDCIQKPDEMMKWKVIEKKDNESIIQSHTHLGEKNQKRISNFSQYIITDC